MKAVCYKEVESTSFNNDVAKGVEGRVLIGKDDGATNFCMRVFEISKDGNTPRHTHDWEHEIFIHAGSGKVLLGDEWQTLSPGTAIFIPGNVDHQMKNTGNELLVVVCLVPSGAPEL